MHDKRTPSLAEQDAHTDSVILGLLIYGEAQRPWSVDEIKREVGSNTADSLARLYGAGLIHRVESFAWASRAAVRAHELDV